MHRQKACGLFFIFAALFLFQPAYSQEEDRLDLEPLVISKGRVHLLKPYSVKSAELTDSGLDSAIEALNHLPVDLQARSPKGAIQTDFSLRASSFQGVLMLLDASRINDPQTAHHNADLPFTKEDLEKIQVLPGVSSAVFGPDAIGGAVNFISKKPQKRQVVLEARGGQYTTWAGLFSASDKIKDLGLRLSVENEESNGFYTDTDFKKFTASFNSSLAFALGEFNLNWGYQEKEFGAYDFYTPASGYQSKEWTKTYLLNTGFNLNKEGLVIKPNFLWRRHHDKFMLDKTLIRSRYLNHHTTDMYTPSVYFQKELPVVGRAGIGLEYGEEKINSTNLGKHSRDHKSVFIDDSLDITEKLSSGLSFRMDDFQVFHAAYTGQASLRLALRKNDFLRLGVARNIRIPSFTELYYNDPTTLGNSGLSEEKSMNYQLGLDCKREKLSFGITGFFRKEDDFIDWVKTSAAQAKWQVQNITKAYVTGCENYLKLKINDIFDLDCSYTYANRNVRQQGLIYKYGKNYARHLLNNTFNFRLPFGAQALAFTYKKKAGRNGWFILDAHLSYKVNKHTQVFLNASNLLGIGYQEIEGIPSPRRWVEGGARLNW